MIVNTNGLHSIEPSTITREANLRSLKQATEATQERINKVVITIFALIATCVVGIWALPLDFVIYSNMARVEVIPASMLPIPIIFVVGFITLSILYIIDHQRDLNYKNNLENYCAELKKQGKEIPEEFKKDHEYFERHFSTSKVTYDSIQKPLNDDYYDYDYTPSYCYSKSNCSPRRDINQDQTNFSYAFEWRK